MSLYHDIDLFGSDNTDGTPIVYYSSNAIKNALNQWMNSKRGDYLMNPSAGGPLDKFLFKTVTKDNAISLKMQLFTALVNEFQPAIDIKDVTITPDYINNITEIEVIYSIPTEGITDSLSLFLNSKYTTNTFEYQIVEYTGANLLEFLRIKKSDMASSRLIYDHEINSWKYGVYKLVNLQVSDQYFTDILIVCNGS